MGYTTEFVGKLELSTPATPEQVAYIQAFNKTRRMKRDATITETMPDPLRVAVGLPVGVEGAYYVGDEEARQNFGQNRTPDIIDYNASAGMPVLSYFDAEWQKTRDEAIKSGKGQPSLWCQWTLTDDGKFLEWDGGEKFYNYVKWLRYLIENFFSTWSINLNGSINWMGEDRGDRGTIVVSDNTVDVF